MAACRATGVGMLETSLLAVLLTGLLGGAHCVGMCGGIVAAMSLHADARATPAFHVLYSLGRIGSYTLAGGVAGLLGSAAFLSESLYPLQVGLYAAAQLVLVLLGLYLAGLDQHVLWLERGGALIWRRLQPVLGRVLPVRTPGQALVAGALWGWLPCGLVYSVLVSALASGSAMNGAVLLLAFGLGTLPNLLLMGWAAERLRTWTRLPWVRRVSGLAVGLMGLWGLLAL